MNSTVSFQDDIHRNSNDLSEKVKPLAKDVYDEFERLIIMYGANVVEHLMPLIVNILENLEDLYREKTSNELELELLKEHFSALKDQYEREKIIKKHNEQRVLDMEYEFEGERKEFCDKIELFENANRNLENKIKAQKDTVLRYEEKIDELKQENSKLYRKYTEIFKSHGEFLSRMRISSSVRLNEDDSPVFLPINRSSTHHNQNHDDWEINTLSPPMVNYEDSDRYSSCGAVRSEGYAPTTFTETLAHIFGKDREHYFGEAYDEVRSVDLNPTLDSDFENTDDELGNIRREIEYLVKENQELNDTKNALNIVKDDLITKVDSLTRESDILKEDIRMHLNKNSDLIAKVGHLEDLVKRYKSTLKRDTEAEQESAFSITTNAAIGVTSRERTFSRSEMAVLLQERNHYKEKLLELQDALVYTENMRMKKQMSSSEESSEKPNKITHSTLWNFFKKLLKTDEDEEEVSTSLEERAKVLKGRDTEFVLHDRLFRFKLECDRSQLYSWSVPRTLIENSLPKRIPIPLKVQRIFDSKDKILCISSGYKEGPDIFESSKTGTGSGNSSFGSGSSSSGGSVSTVISNVVIDTIYTRPAEYLWCLLRPGRTKNQFLLMQIGLRKSKPELEVKYSIRVKLPSRPTVMCEVPGIIHVIKGINRLVLSDLHEFQKPVGSKTVKITNTDIFGGKGKNSVGSKTLWIGCDKNQIVILVLYDNNKLEGRMGTITTPGEYVNIKYLMGRVLVGLRDGSICIFTLNKDFNQWEISQCISIDLSLSVVAATASKTVPTTAQPLKPLKKIKLTAAVGTDSNGKNLWFSCTDSSILVFNLVKNCVLAKLSIPQHNRNISILQEVVAITKYDRLSIMVVSTSQSGCIFGFDLTTFEVKLAADLTLGVFDLIDPIQKSKMFDKEIRNNKDVKIPEIRNLSKVSLELKSDWLSYTSLTVDSNDKLWLHTDSGMIIIIAPDSLARYIIDTEHKLLICDNKDLKDDNNNNNNNYDTSKLGNQQKGLCCSISSEDLYISSHAFVQSTKCLTLLRCANNRLTNSFMGPLPRVGGLEYVEATDDNLASLMLAVGTTYINLNDTAADTLSMSNYAVLWKV